MRNRNDFLALVAGRALAVLVMLLSVRISTSRLSASEYGALSLLVAYQLFCGLVLVNPVSQFINRNTHAWHDEGVLGAALKKFGRWIVASAVLGATAVFGVVAWTARDASAGLMAALLILVMAPLAAWNSTFVWLLNMFGRRIPSVTWSVATTTVGLLVSWLFTREVPTASAWFAGQICGMAVGALGARHAVRRMSLPQARWPATKPFIDRTVLALYCLPLAVVTLFMWAMVSGYRLLVEWHWGIELLGFAAVGLGLANQMLSLVETLLMQYLYPLFYRRSSSGDAALPLSDLLNVAGPLYVLGAAGIVMACHALMFVLVAPSYRGAAVFLALGALLELSRVLTGLFSNAAHVRRRTWPLLMPWLAGAALSAFLLTASARLEQPLIMGIACLVLGGAVVATWTALRMRREVGYRLDARRWSLAGLTLLLAVIVVAANGLAEAADHRTVVVQIVAVAAVIGAIAAGILRKSPALGRLVATNLR